MKVFTETPSAAASCFEPRDFSALADPQGDPRSTARPVGRRRRRTRFVLYIGEVDVVAGHPDVDRRARPGARCRQLGGGVAGQQVQQDAAGHGAAEHVGDPLGHLAHHFVAQLAHRDHVQDRSPSTTSDIFMKSRMTSK